MYICLYKFFTNKCTGIDVDIDVEHEGNRAKVTPPPSASSGPPSGRSDSSSGGPSKGADGSPSSVGSTNGGAKVTKDLCQLPLP